MQQESGIIKEPKKNPTDIFGQIRCVASRKGCNKERLPIRRLQRTCIKRIKILEEAREILQGLIYGAQFSLPITRHEDT